MNHETNVSHYTYNEKLCSKAKNTQKLVKNHISETAAPMHNFLIYEISKWFPLSVGTIDLQQTFRQAVSTCVRANDAILFPQKDAVFPTRTR